MAIQNSNLPPSFVNEVVKIVEDETIVRNNLKSVSDVYSWIEEYGRTLNSICISHCWCDVQKSDVRFTCPIRALQSYNGVLFEYRMPICVAASFEVSDPLTHFAFTQGSSSVNFTNLSVRVCSRQVSCRQKTYH
ncbi:hypothetical protein AVEN_5512-1 [Araneus ventricosus]|uniref:Uncharacterized protein n=1 Tax=Araneus ventricosus TaxID=182803 RepID=A0A4Y2V3A4_ARAVE|nr:hypothetical protein AVEN_8476-1 [Araneus ventricosus]GBO19759.1 hypothetical protein AVEN_5512-1 [Araneus ventricosus]